MNPTEYLNKLFRVLIPELEKTGTDFFVVGAVARDLGLGNEYKSKKLTEDIDIAIRVGSIETFQILTKRLIETGRFTEIGRNPIKYLFDNALEVDFLPFGDLEDANREVSIPMSGRSFVLSVPGLEEVRALVKTTRLESGQEVYYCPPEGIVLLKLISWYEKPGRTKDRDDIEHICKVYFDYCGDEIYEASDLLDAYDTAEMDYMKLVASHYLGRKVRSICRDNEMLINIINKRLAKADGLFRALLDGFND